MLAFPTRKSQLFRTRAISCRIMDTFRDELQETIAEIHRTYIWHVDVSVDGNASRSHKTDFIEKMVVILIRDRNFKCFKAENKELALDQKLNSQNCGNLKLCFLWLEKRILKTSTNGDI